MDTLLHDLRYSVRSLLNHPRFSSISILTLAVGIGANTAIFSVVNGVLLKDLPYAQPDQLVALATVMTDGRATGGAVSSLEMHALRTDEFPSVSAVTGSFLYDLTVLDSDNRPIRVNSYGVTEEFFETFSGCRYRWGAGSFRRSSRGVSTVSA